jgi:hypothetical protein
MESILIFNSATNPKAGNSLRLASQSILFISATVSGGTAIAPAEMHVQLLGDVQ